MPIHVGITVEPGDVIICDIDGVAVVPFSRIDEVITKLESLTAAEAVFEARVKSGLAEPDYIKELMSLSKTLYVD
mgnify:FL=1